MKHFNKAVRSSKLYIIHRFHANVERQIRLLGYIGKNFDFTQTRRHNTKLHDPNKRKIVWSRPGL